MPGTTDTGSSPRVIVTRPEKEAQAWAQALQSLGVQTEILPLMDIVALPDVRPLVGAWQSIPGHLAVMFVSANAVRFFMASRPAGAPIHPCRAWSTGPGTCAALLAGGWPAELIDSPNEQSAQFDSETLWSLVAESVQDAVQQAAPSVKPSVLIVRGADAQGQMAGRDWLAQTLDSEGLQVAQVVAYARQAPELTPAQRDRAHQAMTDGSWWLFSSSEAAQYLLHACPDLRVGQGKALATHPRIAERLKQSGWGRVDTVPAGLQAQAVSIKSLA